MRRSIRVARIPFNLDSPEIWRAFLDRATKGQSLEGDGCKVETTVAVVNR
jgi:hypothetical protein